MPAGEPESLPAVEPAVHGLGRVAGEWSGARLVALPVQYAERAAGGVEVFREERQRLGDTQPGAEEHSEQSPVADAGRRATRADGAERLDVGGARWPAVMRW